MAALALCCVINRAASLTVVLAGKAKGFRLATIDLTGRSDIVGLPSRFCCRDYSIAPVDLMSNKATPYIIKPSSPSSKLFSIVRRPVAGGDGAYEGVTADQRRRMPNHRIAAKVSRFPTAVGESPTRKIQLPIRCNALCTALSRESEQPTRNR
jgi:hypothetical protein